MPDSTRCKLTCVQVNDLGYAKEVLLQATYDETLEEDRRFARATPVGEFSFRVDNPALDGFFSPGRAYYLDLVPVQEPILDDDHS